jgi:hypothetical protein
MKILFITSTLAHFTVLPKDTIHMAFLLSGTTASVCSHMFPELYTLYLLDLGLAASWGIYEIAYKKAFLVNILVFLLYHFVELSNPSFTYSIGHTIFHLCSAAKEYYIVKEDTLDSYV